jgi:hypothetical protein
MIDHRALYLGQNIPSVVCFGGERFDFEQALVQRDKRNMARTRQAVAVSSAVTIEGIGSTNKYAERTIALPCRFLYIR